MFFSSPYGDEFTTPSSSLFYGTEVEYLPLQFNTTSPAPVSTHPQYIIAPSNMVSYPSYHHLPALFSPPPAINSVQVPIDNTTSTLHNSATIITPPELPSSFENSNKHGVSENLPHQKPPAINTGTRDIALSLIDDYLKDKIPFSSFVSKMKAQLNTGSGDGKKMYEYIVRSMVESDHSQRMSTFLMEGGLHKDELEAASSHSYDEYYSDEEDTDPSAVSGEKRKKRQRKRVSISKGIRNPPNKWTKQESEKLIRLVVEFGEKSWKKISEHLGADKTGAQCAQHWKRVLSPEIKKGSWDDQEEELLFMLVQKYGATWKSVAADIKTRTDIQCRYQYQKACLSRQSQWAQQEDALLQKKIALYCQEFRETNWSEVSKYITRAKLTKIPRTALECKERYMFLNNNNIINTNNPATQLQQLQQLQLQQHQQMMQQNSLSHTKQNP